MHAYIHVLDPHLALGELSNVENLVNVGEKQAYNSAVKNHFSLGWPLEKYSIYVISHLSFSLNFKLLEARSFVLFTRSF